MRFLRRLNEPFQLEMSMAGVKLGTRVLQVGSSSGLIAALATKVGLSGQASVIVETRAGADLVQRAAARAGVLLDVRVAPLGALPFEPASFDLVVVPDLIGNLRPEDRVLCLQQILRMLRPGGRCLVIEPMPRGGLGALFSRPARDRPYGRHGGAETALKEEGFRAVRVLAERQGLLFTEGVKPAS